ncbi:hypothetical protein PN462_18960 [Spirulina sp. CS-785/01]|uniref:hypothetical protein n=1 Tax=Spirulina sp. CS-785/01 TaxID=3021716 RepID=UPI00232BA2F4|nr:hypothetical protein [Spirulina sp. CS-785/01]MDB9315202.1 hypothetical protein [Spirulina sp. CS-785/01]
MANTTAASAQFASDQAVWGNLKDAIANSSGFQRWQIQRRYSDAPVSESLDEQVQTYLRETLETLAY